MLSYIAVEALELFVTKTCLPCVKLPLIPNILTQLFILLPTKLLSPYTVTWLKASYPVCAVIY